MDDLKLEYLLDYTDWERTKWRDWFQQHGDDSLKISVGQHGDGRFHTVGDLIRHIFPPKSVTWKDFLANHLPIHRRLQATRMKRFFNSENKAEGN